MKGRPNFCPSCGVSLTYSRKGTVDPLIGRIIDDTYEVIELIGEGSMGRVYRAQHVQLRKQVALKILHTNLVSDFTVVKRFEREAQAASRLNHPNCISMFGYGREDDGALLWMAMEFIEGRDLGVIIAEDSPLPARRVLNIMAQVCDALDEAHSAKVIHRDLKPANIVCFDHRRTKDFVKVLDFGIAKIIDNDEDFQPLTREGIVCGTPAYMSPEQVQGFELDPRSDLFSLGIILYQTLTGRLPFLGDSAVEVATKIVVDQPVSPSDVRDDWSYPPEFESIVLKLLSKNREDRFEEAHEVKRALEKCLNELHDRRDASLDLRPDELAEILAGIDASPAGTDTVRISDELVAQALRTTGEKSDGPAPWAATNGAVNTAADDDQTEPPQEAVSSDDEQADRTEPEPASVKQLVEFAEELDMPNNEELASGLNDSSTEPSGKESPKVLWLVAGLAVGLVIAGLIKIL
ncbi:MAG: serine/threonine-protein kinase [Myxococcota bacterium]|nr:serine/threonine-protein kinase [Myxococcota bacterium]